MRQHGYRIDKATVRDKLAVRNEPYWISLGTGRAIGFRRSAVGAGTWIGRWTWPARELNNGRPKYQQESLGSVADVTYGDALAIAHAFFENCETQWKSRAGGDSTAAIDTAEDACHAYVENMRVEKGDGPADRAAGLFRTHVYGKPLGQTTLKDLSAFHVQGWRNQLVTKDRKKNTVNRIFRQFAAAMNFIKKRGRLKDDNIWKSVGQFDVEDGRRNHYLGEHQRRVVLATCDREKDERDFRDDEDLRFCTPDLGTFLRGLMYTGARPGELAKAKVADFDDKEQSLTLTSYKNKKGKAKIRRFYLYEPAALEFFRHMARGKLPTDYLVTKVDGSPWVYADGKLKGQPRRREWCSGMKAAIREANEYLKREMMEVIPSGTVAYTARHSVITDMLDDGIESQAVQAVLGTSAAMIDKHYDQNKEKRLKTKLTRLQERRSF